ncbi:MAG: hypothetical protein U1F43_02820 [Myxococcota bacterium]
MAPAADSLLARACASAACSAPTKPVTLPSAISTMYMSNIGSSVPSGSAAAARPFCSAPST